MPATDREIRTAADAVSITEDILAVYDGWYNGRNVDWDDFIDRLENRGYDLGDSMESAAIREIRRIVGDHKKLG